MGMNYRQVLSKWIQTSVVITDEIINNIQLQCGFMVDSQSNLSVAEVLRLDSLEYWCLMVMAHIPLFRLYFPFAPSITRSHTRLATSLYDSLLWIVPKALVRIYSKIFDKEVFLPHIQDVSCISI